MHLAEQVCRETEFTRPQYLDTLAASQAAAGQFAQAIVTAEKAVALARQAGLHEVAAATGEALEFYRAGLPYREGARADDLRRQADAPAESSSTSPVQKTDARQVDRHAARRAFLAQAQSLVEEGRWEAAGQALLTVLNLCPDDADVLVQLALLRERQGRTHEAIGYYQAALRVRPDWHEVANDLAWILATDPRPAVRDPRRAVALAERICRAPDEAPAAYLDTLAAAYAADGRFDQATATVQRAIETARAAGLADAPLQQRLALYRQDRPFVEPAANQGRPPAP